MVESNKKSLKEIIDGTKLKIAIIGATGAIGKEIIDAAKQSTFVEALYLIVRKPLEEWKQEDFKPQLNVIQKENFDDLSDVGEQLKDVGIDTFMCTLGTQTKHGKETYIKVDYQYPLNFAQLAKDLGIPNFCLLTSSGACSKSPFFYLKTKGQTEDAIKALELPQLSIFQPGLLLNRRNDDRTVENLAAYIPFISKIEASVLGIGMLKVAYAIKLGLAQEMQTQDSLMVLNNKSIKNWAKKEPKELYIDK